MLTLSEEMRWAIPIGLSLLGLVLTCTVAIVKGALSRMEETAKQSSGDVVAHLRIHTAEEKEIIEAIRASLRQQERRADALENRMTKLEQRADDMPTRGEVHQVSLGLANLSGDIKAITARFEGVDKMYLQMRHLVGQMHEAQLIRSDHVG